MTSTLGGLPFYAIEFDETGRLRSDAGLHDAVAAGQVDDLFVMSHGWNSSADSAQRLYTTMFGVLGDVLGQRAPQKVGRTAVAGVFWPSLLFPDDDPATPAAPAAATASSGQALAAALAPAFPAEDRDNLVTIGKLLDEKGGPDQLVEFHQRAAQLVRTPGLDEGEDSGETATRDLPAGTVISYYSGWPRGDQGDAQGLGNPLDALWDGARDVLRTLSYYEMKNRAGVVGRAGLGPYVSRLSTPNGRPRVHLLGHSFGARLVAYALSGLDAGLTGPASPAKSLVLIQGAFSHFTFTPALPFDAGRRGSLADFRNRVDGPLLSTFSAKDRAVGWWYPLASMLKRQDANSHDDLLRRWGAMGGDGFQTDDASTVDIQPAGGAYAFDTGNCYRIDANSVIKAMQSAFAGAHSDICHPEVAWAAIAAAKLVG